MVDEPDESAKPRWQDSTAPAVAPAEKTTVQAGRAMADRTIDTSRKPEDAARDPAPVARFEEIEELGRGGMGRVYAAFDHQLNRVVAVKQVTVAEESMLARFDREVLIAARLQHPNILPVLDAGRDASGLPFYVMSKIDGRTLDQLVDAASTAASRLAYVPNVAAVVDAVAYAHSRNVLHRDIKPANILVGSFGETLLIDWGIARIVGDAEPELPMPKHGALTSYGSAMGTPGFMPPEQARGEVVGRPADVYALGGTLYYVLAAVRPFSHLGGTAIVEQVSRDAEPDFSRIPSDTPAELVTILRKAMAPRVDARYRDAGELSRDLRAFLTGQLVATHEYTLRELAVRWLRRHRAVVTLAAIALVALGAVSALSIRNILASRDAARAARDAARTAQQAEEVRAGDLIETIAFTDPDRALAMLAALPPESTIWSRAQATVITAVQRGAGRGLSIGSPLVLEPSPDGEELAWVDPDNHTIRIGTADLRGPTTTFKLPQEISEMQWTREGFLVRTHKPTALVLVNASTGATRALDIGAAQSAQFVPGVEAARPIMIVERRLLAIDTQGGSPTELARDVIDAARLRGATLIETATELAIVRDSGERIAVATGAPARWSARPDGTRFAYTTPTELVEATWNPASGLAERGRWALPSTLAGISFCGDRVVARVGRELHSYVPNRQAPAVVRPPEIPTRFAWTPTGMYIGGGTTIAFSTGDELVELAHVVRPGFVFKITRSHVLEVDLAGTLRSWSRSALEGSLWNVPKASPGIMLVERQHAVIVDDASAGVWSIDLATGASMALDAGSMNTPGVACSVAGGWLAFSRLGAWQWPQPLYLISAGPPRSLDVKVRAVLGCDDDVVAILTVAGVEIRNRAQPERVLMSLAADPESVAYNHGRVVVHRGDGGLEVFDASGRSVAVLPVGQIDSLAIDRNGVVAFAQLGRLSLWDGRNVKQIELGDLAIERIGASELGFVARGRRNNLQTDSAIVVDRSGHVTRYAHSGISLPVTAGTRLLTTDASGNVTISNPIDHSMSILAIGPNFDSVVLDDHGASVVAMRSSAGLLRKVSLEEVPRDPVLLRGWVLAWTNARLEPGAHDPTFPAP